MNNESPFTKSYKITNGNIGSCDVYHMKPNSHEPKHYHECVEIIYVLKGNCKTHKEGQVYKYKKGEIHDSDNELVVVCLTIDDFKKYI